ncbi:hypothetical protein PC116_g16817 [Phytophthora cactorum]|uniref:Uncharacterized protein n=1 Tax=Phytophthora cactorum TaxID=29920 RepID=A0A8T1KHK2_9STRA|nr:hypothetical protein PC114_g18430 [Phytophthora cactorum]KAG2902031.1 hypothetical protein PC115_g15707 [Phytophthora cactorum]KAG3054990.1 hypothetical protein PC121_g16020 [Phytophthora cactorum]KAG4047505.1 hypothetical protein PC123_g17139 [Phytophthora cactorum]KAG4235032.1 hypothetical protein PC116_g16817 [Phytophthora cactorum]
MKAPTWKSYQETCTSAQVSRVKPERTPDHPVRHQVRRLGDNRQKPSFATTFFFERCSIDDAKGWLCNKIREYHLSWERGSSCGALARKLVSGRKRAENFSFVAHVKIERELFEGVLSACQSRKEGR